MSEEFYNHDTGGVAHFNMVDVEAHVRDVTERSKTASEKLLEATKAKCESYLLEAIETRDNLYRDAEENGRKAGYEEGFEKGQKEARDEIYATERESLAQKADQVATFLTKIPDRLERGRQMLEEQFEHEFLKLVVEVASMAVKRDIQEVGSPIKEIVKDLMNSVLDRRHVTITTHHDNIHTLEQMLPEMHEQFTDLEKVILKGADIDAHRVLISTELGTLEASPDLALERIRKEWSV